MSFFRGKVVIVTGSSVGIGREIARVFAGKGAKLTITGRNSEALEKTKEECVAAGVSNENVLVVLGEITDEATLKKIVDETVARFGQIDILVNNAGAAVPTTTAFLEETSSDHLDKTMAINAKSPGVIRTEFQQRMGMDNEGKNKLFDIFAKTLIGRVGEPGDIAKAVLFLADRSQSEFIVGQRLVVDGGASLENKFMSYSE